MSDLALQLRDYRLTTAEIVYHLPDYPELLQSYIWQKLDLSPHFPVLRRFLDFWSHNLDGKLHSVYVANGRIIKPAELTYAGCELRLH
ncbi:MAG: Usg family protein [Alphaproteobacteria bacterium]